MITDIIVYLVGLGIIIFCACCAIKVLLAIWREDRET